MPKYRFCVTRPLTESVEVEVDAATLKEAHAAALGDVDKYAVGKDAYGYPNWELDECSEGSPCISDSSYALEVPE